LMKSRRRIIAPRLRSTPILADYIRDLTSAMGFRGQFARQRRDRARLDVLFVPNAGASGGIYLRSIETAARKTGTELIVSAVHDPTGIDEVFAAMAQETGAAFWSCRIIS